MQDEKKKFIEEDELLINQAIDLKNKSEFHDSLNILLPMLSQYPNDSRLYGLVATNHYLMEDYSNSRKFFLVTVELNPKSELASLGLFHSYRELKKFRKSFQELDRFLSNNQPNLYKVTLEEQYKQLSGITSAFGRKIVLKYYHQYRSI